MVGILQLINVENELYIHLCSVFLLQGIKWHLEIFLPCNKANKNTQKTLENQREKEKNPSQGKEKPPVF